MPDLAPCLKSPVTSPEHSDIIFDMIVVLSGVFGARYYLTILQESDFSVSRVGDGEFLNALAEHLKGEFGTCQRSFFSANATAHAPMIYETCLARRFQLKTGVTPPLYKPTKEDLALEMLFGNPGWTDAQIRDAVGTTDKQLAQWSRYSLARAEQGLTAKGMCYEF